MKTRTHMTQQIARRLILAVLIAVVLTAVAGSGWALAAEEKTMPLGSSEVLDFQGIKRAAVADPSIVDYVVLSAKQVMITTKAPGATDLHVWDEKGQHTFHLVVVAPPSRMPETVKKIQEMIGQPGITVSEINGVVILEGEAETPYEAQRAGAIAGAYAPKVQNLIQVRPVAAPPAAPGPPAVGVASIQAAVGPNVTVYQLTESTLMFEGTATPEQRKALDRIIGAIRDRKWSYTEGAWGTSEKVKIVDMVSTPGYEARRLVVHVKVVDIDKSAVSNIGIDWGGLTRDTEGLFTAHDQPILFGEVFTGRQPQLPANDGGPLRRLDGISARLQALVTDNKARILAEPNVLVNESEITHMHVGGEIPIPIVQSIPGAGAPTVTIQYKPFGVLLWLAGDITADGKSLILDVTPEVSNLDFANAIVISGFTIPALRVRRSHTVVQIADGQTLVIGGLYQNDISNVIKKIPLLGDIPIIGEFFKHTVKSKSETELMIFVTPEIVTEASAKARTDAALETLGKTQ